MSRSVGARASTPMKLESQDQGQDPGPAEHLIHCSTISELAKCEALYYVQSITVHSISSDIVACNLRVLL